MKEEKRKRLVRAGWVFGNAPEFLDLSPEEAAFVEMKVALSKGLRIHRSRKNLTQAALANRLGSSQSRIAKAEAGDPSISVDLLVRALFAAGATKEVSR